MYWQVDLRNAVQAAKNDLDVEKKRNNELAEILHEKTKQCAKVQVSHLYSYVIHNRHYTINWRGEWLSIHSKTEQTNLLKCRLQSPSFISINWVQTDDNPSYHQQDYHSFVPHTIQRQPLYPRIHPPLKSTLNLDSPPTHARTYNLRPTSSNQGQQQQGIRSGAVSAAGRTPLERLSTNVVTTGGTYRGGGNGGVPVKGIVGRGVFGRKWGLRLVISVDSFSICELTLTCLNLYWPFLLNPSSFHKSGDANLCLTIRTMFIRSSLRCVSQLWIPLNIGVSKPHRTTPPDIKWLLSPAFLRPPASLSKCGMYMRRIP